MRAENDVPKRTIEEAPEKFRFALDRDIAWLQKYHQTVRESAVLGVLPAFYVKQFLDGFERYWGEEGRKQALDELNAALTIQYTNEAWWSEEDYLKRGVTPPGKGPSVEM